MTVPDIKTSLLQAIKIAADFKAQRYKSDDVLQAIDAANAAPGSKQAFAKKYKFASGNVYSKFASEVSNPFTAALAKLLSGRVPVSETQTLKGPAGDIISNKSGDESIGNFLMRLNPAQALNRALGE